jgi:hypothetical protein
MTPTRASVLRRAAELGAKVEDNTSRHRSTPAAEHIAEIVLDAPHGQLWAGNDCHTWVLRSDAGERFPWADVAEAMAYGLEPCPDAGSGCEWCDEAPRDTALGGFSIEQVGDIRSRDVKWVVRRGGEFVGETDSTDAASRLVNAILADEEWTPATDMGEFAARVNAAADKPDSVKPQKVVSRDVAAAATTDWKPIDVKQFMRDVDGDVDPEPVDD